MNSSTRLVFNTSIQYFRSIISLFISFYTVRLILDALGIENYGIYSIVSGVVSMLSFIQSSLAQTTQRYLSFHQGRGDLTMQKKIFNNSVITQLLISIALVAILAALKPVLFGGFLNIEPDRLNAAVGVYFCMLAVLFFTMQSAPYMATLIAHENILYTTIVELLNIFLKIPIALMLYHAPFDKLIYYAVLSLGLQVLNFLLYYIYCKLKYPESKDFNFNQFDKQTFRDIFSFMGWNIYSTGCIVAKNQGFAIILNKMAGVVWNAAWGIASQVAGQINFISVSMQNAIRPQIVKAEGAGDRKRMLRLSEISSKFSFMLLAMVSIPLFIEMTKILPFWLKEVPEGTVLFCQMILIVNIVDQLTSGLAQANQAIGDVKNYSLLFYTPKLLLLPATYLILFYYDSKLSVMFAFVMIELIVALLRLPFLKSTGGLSINEFVNNVFIKELVPFILTAIACWGFSQLFDSLWGILGTCIISLIIMGITTYYFGLCNDEKIIIKALLEKTNSKLIKTLYH